MSCNYLAPQQAHQTAEPLIKKWKNKVEKIFSKKNLTCILIIYHRQPVGIRFIILCIWIRFVNLKTYHFYTPVSITQN